MLSPAIGEPLAKINWAAVGLGVFTLAVNYAFPKVTTKVPSVLVALLAGTGAALALGLKVPVVGDIPTGLPAPQPGTIFSVAAEHYVFILQSGLTLALLGSIDSLLTAVIADNLTKTQHDSRRELIGQGIGNTIAAVFGGIPGAGGDQGHRRQHQGRCEDAAVRRDARAVPTGGAAGGRRTGSPYIPLPVLAGLLISVGIAIIDLKGLKHLTDVPKADAAVLIVVLVWTVFGNLIHAVGAGVVLASVLFMKKAADLIEAGSTVKLHDPEPGLGGRTGRRPAREGSRRDDRRRRDRVRQTPLRAAVLRVQRRLPGARRSAAEGGGGRRDPRGSGSPTSTSPACTSWRTPCSA